MSRDRDIRDIELPKQGIIHTAYLAAGTGDATEITGTSIDRFALGSRYQSMDVLVQGNNTMASGETFTLTFNLQDSSDDSTFADFGTPFTAAIIQTAAGAAVTKEPFEQRLPSDILLNNAKRYVRLQVTPNLSASGTDTGLISATMIFGAPETYPAS